LKAGLKRFIRPEQGIFSVDSVYKSLDNRVSATWGKHQGNISAVYAYEDGAFCKFYTGKKFGHEMHYDCQSHIGKTSKKLLSEEADRPGWKQTLGGGIKIHRRNWNVRAGAGIADMVLYPAILFKLPSRMVKKQDCTYGAIWIAGREPK